MNICSGPASAACRFVVFGRPTVELIMVSLCLKSPNSTDIENIDVLGVIIACESSCERSPPLGEFGISQALSVLLVLLEISLAVPKDPNNA